MIRLATAFHCCGAWRRPVARANGRVSAGLSRGCLSGGIARGARVGSTLHDGCRRDGHRARRDLSWRRRLAGGPPCATGDPRRRGHAWGVSLLFRRPRQADGGRSPAARPPPLHNRTVAAAATLQARAGIGTAAPPPGRAGAGRRLERHARHAPEFRFDSEAYTFEVDAQVERDDGSPVPFSFLWQGRFGEESAASAPFVGSQEANIVYRDGTSFERLSVSSIETPNDVPATTYVGVEDRYFLAMFMLSNARPPAVSVVGVDLGDDELEPTGRVEVPYVGDPVRLYVGPQQRESLAAVDEALSPVLDYGFFEVLSRPMMFFLVLIHGYVGNWGWSIVVFTFFLNIAFFPLRLKQQLSMQKMQKIQPQMRTLQDKYKKMKAADPRRPEVQAEMMGLYKKNGVNPLGSCFPMLLQMPFLIAIFWALQVSVELRQAPWMLWIQDLSAADPYYVLPILFGASMFAQQKMMPTAMDPMQARIMMFMPIMLTVMFIGSQSGLMLYWLTSTLFGVGQQYLIKKHWAPADKPKRARAPQPTEDRPVIETQVVSASEDSDSSESKRRKRRRKR